MIKVHKFCRVDRVQWYLDKAALTRAIQPYHSSHATYATNARSYATNAADATAKRTKIKAVVASVA